MNDLQGKEGKDMNVLQNLVELYNHLPMDSTYREVAKGILTNLEEVADATIYDVAELTASSRTTVWRMIQKMGYSSYSEFRHALKQSVSHYSYYNRLLPLCPGDEPVEEVFASQIKAVAKSLKKDLDGEGLKEMAGLVAGKRQVGFYMPFHSGAVTTFQQNLSMAGKVTAALSLLPDMMEDAGHMEPEGMAFCVTIEHAEAQDMTPLFRTLKERGAQIALFSSGRSRYEDFVDFHLCGGNEGGSAMNSVMRCELYLFALSEVFRREYLGK